MKVIIPFLLILVPAIWFYIKVFSKKATVYLDGNMFISTLYEALINNDIEKARKLYNSFSIKAMRDPNYILFLQNLPPNHKNNMCLSFINSEMEITKKTQSKIIDLYIGNIKEENIAETEAAIKADIDSGAFAQVGRNEPCPCGSGKRYKDCHGKIS